MMISINNWSEKGGVKSNCQFYVRLALSSLMCSWWSRTSTSAKKKIATNPWFLSNHPWTPNALKKKIFNTTQHNFPRKLRKTPCKTMKSKHFSVTAQRWEMELFVVRPICSPWHSLKLKKLQFLDVFSV